MIPVSLRNKYRYSLLHRNSRKSAVLEQEILKSKGTREELNREKKWAHECFSILDQALLFKKQGVGLNSKTFIQLEKQIEKFGKIALEVFREIVQKQVQTDFKDCNFDELALQALLPQSEPDYSVYTNSNFTSVEKRKQTDVTLPTTEQVENTGISVQPVQPIANTDTNTDSPKGAVPVTVTEPEIASVGTPKVTESVTVTEPTIASVDTPKATESITVTEPTIASVDTPKEIEPVKVAESEIASVDTPKETESVKVTEQTNESTADTTSFQNSPEPLKNDVPNPTSRKAKKGLRVLGHVNLKKVQTKQSLVKSGVAIETIPVQRALDNMNLEKKLKSDRNRYIPSSSPFIIDTNLSKTNTKNDDVSKQLDTAVQKSLATPHTNFVPLLKPSSKWTILIDETGDVFTDDVYSDNVREKTKGKMAAVLVPRYCKLPELEQGYHSYYQQLNVIEDVIHKLLFHSCGVLGITTNSGHAKHGDLWYSTIETLIDLILRLIPIKDETHIEIFVEQREQYTQTCPILVDNICTNCLNRLARSNPYRAKLLDVTGQFISKEDHPLIGYADAVAFCWNAPSATAMLLRSGWKDSCLLGSDPAQFCDAIDAIVRPGYLSIKEWEQLFHSPNVGNPCSLSNVLLQRYGEVVLDNREQWAYLLEHVERNLIFCDINPQLLEQQIEWFNSWKPGENCMTNETRLRWKAIQLIHENQIGRSSFRNIHKSIISNLCKCVYPENSQLACRVELEMALSYMYTYDFQIAYDTIKHWLTESEATAGRLNYGRILLTAGILNACIGNQEVAIEAFGKANHVFSQLSNKYISSVAKEYTQFYKLLAMIDHGEDSSVLTDLLTSYCGGTLEYAASKFAISDTKELVKSHYALLRYLVQNPEQQSVIERYMHQKSWWNTGKTHPWDMIWFYRAILSDNNELRNYCLKQALNIASNSFVPGSEIRACVFLGSLYYYNRDLRAKLKTLTMNTLLSLPTLEEDRTSILMKQMDSPIEPLELAQKILSFMFR